MNSDSGIDFEIDSKARLAAALRPFQASQFVTHKDRLINPDRCEVHNVNFSALITPTKFVLPDVLADSPGRIAVARLSNFQSFETILFCRKFS